jgi:hypothetical protein
MSPESSVLFRSRGEFTEAVLTALASTRRELVLVDHDFSDWPLDTVAGAQALADFLGADREARLRLMVVEPDWLERRAPRFMQLRRRFAGAVDCRQVPPSLRGIEGLAVGDRRHAMRRAHRDFFRGRLSLSDPATVEPLAARCDALWEESTPCLPAQTLGL